MTRGPYRYVRHPFYDSMVLLVVAFALIAANWFIIVTGAVAFTLLGLVVAGIELERLADALLLDEHRAADCKRLLELRAGSDLDDPGVYRRDDGYSAAIGWRCSRISRQIACGVAGMSSWRTPRPASASISALITAAGEATEPASPQPFTPIGLFRHGTSTVVTCMDGMSAACGMA